MSSKKKIKKIPIANRKEFIGLKQFLENKGEDFEYTYCGSIDTIIHDNIEWMSVDLIASGGRGHHLNRVFRKDIDNWILKNKASLPHYPVNYKEQFFHLGAIEKNVGKLGTAIDIQDCYWRTVWQLGYITEKTYISGLRKKEWKTGRNGCIGSLIKSKVSVPHRKGKPDYKSKVRIPMPIEYSYIRNHIIGHVYQMFYELYEQIGDKFCMFLTDCVFTDYQSKKFIENFFEERGYKTTSKPIEFVKIDRKKKMVFWYDFTAKKKDPKAEGTGKERYYIYSNSQIVDGTRIQDIRKDI